MSRPRECLGSIHRQECIPIGCRKLPTVSRYDELLMQAESRSYASRQSATQQRLLLSSGESLCAEMSGVVPNVVHRTDVEAPQ
jgi:hypothetical protein